jgi:hypothetical protein
MAALAIIALFQGLTTDALGATYSSRTITFDQYQDGHNYTRRDAEKDFGNIGDSWNTNGGPHIVDDGILIVRTRANREEGALNFSPAIPPNPAYFAEIKFRFPRSFLWGLNDGNNHIKMPLGFGGGTAPTGGSCEKVHGWSVRFTMNQGEASMYTYDTDRIAGEKCYGGTEIIGGQGDKPIGKGEWHTIKIYVKRNTAGNHDGSLHVWLDGRLLVERDDLGWSQNQVDIGAFMFTIWRGGSGDPPTVDTYIHLDYIKWWQPGSDVGP